MSPGVGQVHVHLPHLREPKTIFTTGWPGVPNCSDITTLKKTETAVLDSNIHFASHLSGSIINSRGMGWPHADFHWPQQSQAIPVDQPLLSVSVMGALQMAGMVWVKSPGSLDHDHFRGPPIVTHTRKNTNGWLIPPYANYCHGLIAFVAAQSSCGHWFPSWKINSAGNSHLSDREPNIVWYFNGKKQQNIFMW